MLQCPRPTCRKLREAARSTLVKGVAWTQLKCPCCMRSSSAAKWLCPCGVAWHSCTDHRSPGFACGAKPRFKKKTRSAAHADPLPHSAPKYLLVLFREHRFVAASRDTRERQCRERSIHALALFMMLVQISAHRTDLPLGFLL